VKLASSIRAVGRRIRTWRTHSLPRDSPTGCWRGHRTERRIAVVEQSANNPTRIWLIDPEHPQPITRLAELQGARVRGVTWAPDGSAIVYGKHDWTSDIVLMQREP